MRYPIPTYCTFKTQLVRERSDFLCDMATEILHEMARYCEAAGLPLEITDSVSTAEEDKALSRVSDEHSTGRAFDLSIHGWIEVAIQDFMYYFENKFLCAAAIGIKSGKAHLIFRHNNGHGEHLHVQVARLFGVKDPLGPDPKPAL